MQNSIISKDIFLKQGLYSLLGEEFIEDFYLIVDFDFMSSAIDIINENEGKEIIAMVSSDIAALRAQGSGVKVIIDKKSRLKDILDTFLFKRKTAHYLSHIELTLREIELFGLICYGIKFEDLAKKLGVKNKTVYTVIRNIRIKVGCQNRFDFQRYYLA